MADGAPTHSIRSMNCARFWKKAERANVTFPTGSMASDAKFCRS